jgi:hypothetical protein
MDSELMPRAAKKTPRKPQDVVVQLKHLATCLTNEAATFTNPSPTPAMLNAEADALLQANVKAKGKSPGAVAARKAKLREAEGMIDEVVVYVEGVVRTQAPDPATAAAMILSAGLSVQKTAKPPKHPLAVKRGYLLGEALLVALAVARNALYYWERSGDQKNWESLPATMQASTSVTGLIPGQVYYFRFRAHTRKGLGDYSDVVRFMAL